MWERIFGPSYPRLAMPYNNLGELELARARYAAARPYLVRSLKLLEKTRGKNYADLFHPLTGLGAAYLGLGRLDDARRSLTRAIGVLAAAQGVDNPRLFRSVLLLAETELAAGRWDAAAAAAKRAAALVKSDRLEPSERGRLRFVQAQLAWHNPATRPRAKSMAQRALGEITGKSPGDKAQRAAVRAWLEAH